MNDDEKTALASLYATWETSTLMDAATHHRGDYDPQALALIVQELTRRDVTVQPLESLKDAAAHALPPGGQSHRQSRSMDRPYIQYVGAWGLNVLLAAVLGVPLALALNGARPHGPSETVAVTLVFIVGGLIASFLAFWPSVKWMIVDRLSQPPEPTPREDAAQPEGPGYGSQARRT